jgi:chromosome segregation ATPase
MGVRFRSYIKFLIATCLVVSFCLVEADAQTRKKRRSRRATKPAVARPVITNPPIAPAEETPATGDVKIISTAEGGQETTSATESKTAKPAASPESEDMQKSINSLSNQVNKLNDKLTQMSEDDRDQRDTERLTRAEQRAEQVRSQLMDVQSKIADFEAKLEQIDFALKPENIESAAAGYGSTRPEAIRDMRKKQLEGERSRVTAQLKLAETSRTRLETASANADAEVDALRAKLQQRRSQADAEPAVETPPKPAPPRKPE